jgi:CheY-like chemotaxis protein
MPVMGGLDATRMIREYEQHSKINPAIIVALTGLASASTQSDAYGIGINFFLTKPASFQKIRAVIVDWRKSNYG